MTEHISMNVPEWFRVHAPLYQHLADVIETTISSLLKAENIDHLAVSARTKTLESITEKIDRKGYQSINDLTDIVGIRVITYIESGVESVCSLIESAFKIHRDKSGDKSAELQSNEIGYRSVHYVCELEDHRLALPEFKQFKGLTFEVQVRTVLQHAWAEIEHDRSYKFSGELPKAIKRRLNLLAGTLEIIDREFESLAKEVDKHKEESKQVAQSGVLAGVELTSAGLTEFMLNDPEISSIPGFTLSEDPLPANLFDEMKAFEITTLEDFKNLITPDFLEAFIRNYREWLNAPVFCRAAMVYKDLDRYFNVIPKMPWIGIRKTMASLLDEKYGIRKVNSVLGKYGIPRFDVIDGKISIQKIPPPPERNVKGSQSSTKKTQ